MSFKNYYNENAQHGFDLTSIKADHFIEILKAVGIDPNSEPENKDNGWHWSGDGIEIVTGNDPITGIYGSAGKRAAELDYASYIGVEGDPDKVASAAKLIKKYADYIKDESRGERQYI